MRWNVRRDCGVESKPTLSGGTLSAWTGRPGVSWTETVVTQRGAVQERWRSTRLELTRCNREFLRYRERIRV